MSMPWEKGLHPAGIQPRNATPYSLDNAGEGVGGGVGGAGAGRVRSRGWDFHPPFYNTQAMPRRSPKPLGILQNDPSKAGGEVGLLQLLPLPQWLFPFGEFYIVVSLP